MNELSDAQYTQLQSRVNMIPWENFKSYLEWTYKGRPLTIADFPNANEARKAQIVGFLNAPRPNPQHDAEWNVLSPDMDKNLSDLSIHELQVFEMRLDNYLSNWATSQPLNNHLDEVKEKIKIVQEEIADRSRQREESEWDNVDKFSIDALDDYYRRYPNTCHRKEIDDTIFSFAKSRPFRELINTLQRYMQIFPTGNHLSEAERIIAAALEWQKVSERRNLLEVFNYVQRYAESPFINEAKILLMQLKSDEINTMKREFNEYPRERLLNFLNMGVFSENELIYASVITQDSLRILRTYDEISKDLPDLNDTIPRCSTECYPDHTDVFMFGVPGTGKSCVLSGMIGNELLNYDSVSSGGAYADALSEYMNYNCPPPPTKMNYLTTIKASVAGENMTHHFNLVEMAGEEFADKIATNPDGVVCFEDMGTGATELLESENPKIFFIIVDPTRNIIRFQKNEEVKDDEGNVLGYNSKWVLINQRLCLKRMIDMFKRPENENVMKKVEAIHFVVTKADTLGDTFEKRLEKAVDVLQNNYHNSIDTLKEVCHLYGINRATDERPMVYPFSLGHFYVGNIFEYDPSDSANLIEVMQGNTAGNRRRNFWDVLVGIFNPQH